MSDNEDLMEALSHFSPEHRQRIVIELMARDIAERLGEKLSYRHQKMAEFIVKETVELTERLIKAIELIKKNNKPKSEK